MKELELANFEDEKWILQIANSNKEIFGQSVRQSWMNYWENYEEKKESEYWVVLRPLAFAHIKLHKSGIREVKSIGVNPENRRMGLGSLILKKIGTPIKLETNEDSEESNAFYKALGFQLLNNRKSISGKMLNRYEKQ